MIIIGCDFHTGGWAILWHHPTSAVEFSAGCRTLRFLKGPGLDAALSTTASNHLPKIISASEY